MEFHVPHVGDEDDMELYEDIKYFLQEVHCQPIHKEGYEYIRYKDEESDIFEAEVGEPHPVTEDVVIAIFSGGFSFYICTQNQGVPGGGPPIIIDKSKILYMRTFDDFD